MNDHRVSRRAHAVRRSLGTALAAVALLAGTVSATPTAAQATCTAKPRIFPVDELRPGMMGVGSTVIQGRTPVTFDVRILGVLPDGILPGIDFILVKLSGPVIEETGGILFGMSGSPVFIDGRLVGALAFGFFAADQTIAGVTPAEAMVEILDYPQGGPNPALPSRVRLTPALHRVAARAAGTPVAQFPVTAKQLLVPLGVSGLNARGMKVLQEAIDREGLPFLAYRANSVSGPTAAAPSSLGPGSALSAALSYGDLASFGTGTTTAVCGDLVLAFGHPFFLQGPTVLGMNAAEILTVVTDPSQIFGGFKVARIAEAVGTVDQDRFAGIRGVTGALPPLVPVASSVENPDLGKSREGRTDVVFEEALPFLAAFHLLGNLDVTFDRIGEGTTTLSWAIDGLRESGEPFRLARQNMYFSAFDTSFESIFELLSQIEILQNQDFEDVSFTGIDIDGSITQRELTATIEKVLSQSSVQRGFAQRRKLFVLPGDTVELRVLLETAEGETRSVDLSIRVPRRRSGEFLLEVRGGRPEFGGGFFFVEGEMESPKKAKSFDQLLAQLAGAEHNFDLVASIELGRRKARKAVSAQPEVVLGQKTIRLILVGGGRGGRDGGPEPVEAPPPVVAT